jgi:hypothetical protein
MAMNKIFGFPPCWPESFASLALPTTHNRQTASSRIVVCFFVFISDFPFNFYGHNRTFILISMKS